MFDSVHLRSIFRLFFLSISPAQKVRDSRSVTETRSVSPSIWRDARNESMPEVAGILYRRASTDQLYIYI